MAITGKLIQKGIKIRESLLQKYAHPFELQKSELLKLLINGQDTSFGSYYEFDKILASFKKSDQRQFFQTFRAHVPIHDYDKIFDAWWSQARAGRQSVCWPGKVKYFAMSSGTSGDSSKYIPVTKDMLKSIRKAGIRQLLSLSRFNIPAEVFNKGVLMLGGSTNLKKEHSYYDADLSGITASKIPFWFQRFYKPGKKISRCDSWGEKLDQITMNAANWDIGFIVGVPAWIQILLEKIIAHYKLQTIHDLWPNLKVFVHGGVSFEPYKNSFSKLLGSEIEYIETYLASEGFFAFQDRPGTSAQKLILNNGIFYEFVPFNDQNFDNAGNIKDGVEALLIDEIDENVDYAMLISTCSGAWRYLIGDVVRFASKERSEITITGRTKHFLSLCGEHLSVDNMNKAIQLVEQELNINIKEFTVAGFSEGSGFSHKWYVGCDAMMPEDIIKATLDKSLKMLNDDYRIERGFALRNVELVKIPSNTFYDFMKLQGKEGGQHKFPRVLKGKKFLEWENYVNTQLKLY